VYKSDTQPHLSAHIRHTALPDTTSDTQPYLSAHIRHTALPGQPPKQSPPHQTCPTSRTHSQPYLGNLVCRGGCIHPEHVGEALQEGSHHEHLHTHFLAELQGRGGTQGREAVAGGTEAAGRGSKG